MTGQKRGTDYYNLLVDGFLDGHTYMKVVPHPDLLSPNPDVRKNAPTLLDANFYRGHFYLYYGVTPAIALMVPYSLLTGHDLSANVVTSVFVAIGFLLSIQVFNRAMDPLGPRRGPRVFTAVAWALLAYGPATLFLVRRSSFYEVPLAAGYACMMGLLWFVARGLRPQARWLFPWSAAGMCFGLAVGCHPNYVFAGPVIAGWIWVSAKKTGYRKTSIRLLVTFAPAALVGLGLALYNYARFGDIFEFGFRYGQNEFFSTHDQFASASFLWPNFRWYFLTPPTVSCYFPFFYPLDASFRPAGYHGIEAIHGEFPLTVLLLWTFAGSLMAKAKVLPARRAFAIGAFALGVIGILFVCTLGIRANRYLVDGVAPLLFATVLVAGAAWADAVGRLGAIWKAGWILCAGFAVVFSWGAAIQQFDYFANTRPKTFALLSRALNPSWETMARAKMAPFPPARLEFDVAFKSQSHGIVEPLFTTGIPYYSDTLYAVQHPGDNVELMLDHYGSGGPRSGLMRIEPGRIYHFQMDVGSLYPPRGDKFFDSFSAAQKERVKTRGVVRMDGALVLSASIPFYDSPPWRREFGANRTTFTAFSRKFSGAISNRRWLPVRDLLRELSDADARGVYRLRVDFSAVPAQFGEPLLSGGTRGRGTLLYVTSDAARYRFHVDEWGVGGSVSDAVEITPGEHRVEIVVGPLAALREIRGGNTPGIELSHRLVVRVDGKIAADLSVAPNSEIFRKLWFGENPQDFSTAEAVFRGRLQRTHLESDEAAEIVRSLRKARKYAVTPSRGIGAGIHRVFYGNPVSGRDAFSQLGDD